MQFGSQQQFATPRLQHFLHNTEFLTVVACIGITFLLVVLVHRKLPHITFIPILIISENLK